MHDLNFAIVIVAYNRANALNQLLLSLSNIITKYDNIDLLISIDNQGTPDVIKTVESFKWNFGQKKIIIHSKKLGLKKHFIWAGNQTDNYEHVLFLEDDLYVSPYVLEFVEAYIKKYNEDDRIAGAALYNPILCEFTKCKFYQFEDGFDNFFFQHPYWGNIWSRHKWMRFKTWLESYCCNEEILPPNVRMWGEQSFKKVYIQYLIENKKYIVYPRNSYVTNMGEKGLHNKYNAMQFQTVLENGSRKLNLSTLDESEAVYDAFFEIQPEILKKHSNRLENYNFCVDLLGLKDNIEEKFVLTCKPTQKPIMSFSSSMRPIEQNIIADILGDEIWLTKTSDLRHLRKLKSRIIKEEKSSEDIMRNYPVRAKHLAFAVWIALKKRKHF